jgi:hypothetical protein
MKICVCVCVRVGYFVACVYSNGIYAYKNVLVHTCFWLCSMLVWRSILHTIVLMSLPLCVPAETGIMHALHTCIASSMYVCKQIHARLDKEAFTHTTRSERNISTCKRVYLKFYMEFDFFECAYAQSRTLFCPCTHTLTHFQKKLSAHSNLNNQIVHTCIK